MVPYNIYRHPPHPHEHMEMDDLRNLSSDEKNKQIINLRQELASTKGQLSDYCDINGDLPRKLMCVSGRLVSCEYSNSCKTTCIRKKSLAYTAKPDKIKKD